MSRTLTTTREVFKFEELSDSAKDTARQDYSTFLWEDGEMQERCKDIANGILEDAGFEPAGDLSYSLYSQGGDPTFSTRTAKPIFVQEPTKGLRRKRYDVTISECSLGGSSSTMDIEVWSLTDGEEVYTPELAEAAKQLVRRLSQEMMSAFYKEDDYMSSDEQLAETSEANEWEYDEDGKMI